MYKSHSKRRCGRVRSPRIGSRRMCWHTVDKLLDIFPDITDDELKFATANCRSVEDAVWAIIEYRLYAATEA